MLFLPWVASTQAVGNDLSRSLLTCILILYRVIWYLSYIDILVYTWWIAILYILMLNKFCLSPESWVLSPGGVIRMTQISPSNTNTRHPDEITYQASWIDAILKDDAHLALQLLNGHMGAISDMILRYEKLYDSNNVGHAIRKHGLMWTTYAPDNVWSSAAVFNARDVMKVLAKKQVPSTGRTSDGNNYLHCLIAFASVEDEETEYEVLSSAKYIRYLMTDEKYREILLSENHLGLRPLELASHLGTMALFKVYIWKWNYLYDYRKEYGFPFDSILWCHRLRDRKSLLQIPSIYDDAVRREKIGPCSSTRCIFDWPNENLVYSHYVL